MDRAQKKLALQKTIDNQTQSLLGKAEGYKSLGKDALLIGGVLVLGYTLFNLFSDDNSDETANNVKEPKESMISAGLKGVATSLMLAVVKDKLMDFIATLDKDEA